MHATYGTPLAAPQRAVAPAPGTGAITLVERTPDPISGIPSFDVMQGETTLGRLHWRRYSRAGWQFLAAGDRSRKRITHGWLVDALVHQGGIDRFAAVDALTASEAATVHAIGPQP
jgi:hypothetical protein